MKVKIVERDGVPLRDQLKFETGTLLPGETLEVPDWQGGLAIAQGTIEVVRGDGAGEQPTKGKRSRVKSGADLLG